MRTYVITVIADSLRDDKQGCEEARQDSVQEAKGACRSDPFSRSEADNFLLAGFLACRDDGRQLGELHSASGGAVTGG